jgi:hypothetical protein
MKIDVIFFGVLTAAVIGLAWYVNSDPQPTISRIQHAMAEEDRAALLNMATSRGRQIINAEGNSCPEVTHAGKSTFKDTGEPLWILSCSDGNRYVVYWSSDNGAVRAMNCRTAGC